MWYIVIVISAAVFLHLIWFSYKVKQQRTYLADAKEHLEPNHVRVDFSVEKSFFKTHVPLKLLQLFRMESIYIVGQYEGLTYEFMQCWRGRKRYSLILIDDPTHRPNFSHILIKKQKGVKHRKDVDLEWNDFNLKLDNRLTNPQQALELLSPTFMERLFDLLNKYNELRFEYYELPELQKNVFACMTREYALDWNRTFEPSHIDNLHTRAKDTVSLIRSI